MVMKANSIKVQNKYNHSIDFLRGGTALLVCIYHFIFHQDANGVLFEGSHALKTAGSILPSSVFIFFSLSGFVIMLSMHRNHFKLNKIGPFLARRWVRIEIPYIASMSIYIAIALLWALKEGAAFSIDPIRILHHLTYTIPFTDYHWFNEVYWTLGLEFQFYILIALIFPLLISKSAYTRFTTIVLFTCTGIFITDLRLVFHYAPVFIFGILIYLHYYTDFGKHVFNLVLLAILLPYIAYFFDLATALYMLLTLLVIRIPVREKNLVARLGKMGYSLYLVHGAIGGSFLYFTTKGISSDITKSLLVIAAILLSIVGSYIFYRIVERPSSGLSRKISFSSKEK